MVAIMKYNPYMFINTSHFMFFLEWPQKEIVHQKNKVLKKNICGSYFKVAIIPLWMRFD